LISPLIQMSNIGTQITEAFAGLDRIREVLSEPREDADERARQPLGPVRGEIRFERVHFEYKPGEPVLIDIDFVSPAGT
ncbi:MAG: ABC transporter ATP-binding protein, partial [Acidobacteria bacterium]|nr:ABC transporter ATP-binding protein [Acidobacteriota bacterium]NIO60522.1 ABC transporter ATP-binding protein [Acidobacteriota bacterium]NIT12195.1 ABC transporter ATP-binding protein [Acidobacteriota bacterium]